MNQTQWTENTSRSEDKFDKMAQLSGGIAGLRYEQISGLAYIFRQIARDEQDRCAEIAASTVTDLEKTPLTKILNEQQFIEVAAAMRHQAEYAALSIKQNTRRD